MKEFSRSGRADFGSFIVDPRGTILGFDQAMETLTGWPALDVVGRSKNLPVTPTTGDPGNSGMSTAPLYEGTIEGGELGATNLQLTLNCHDGRRIDVDSLVRPLNGPGERMLVTVLHVIARSGPNADQPSGSSVDSLTGLNDRDAFASNLFRDFADAVATTRPLSLMIVDVDHLREINDRHGHNAGDEVLRKLAGILRVMTGDEHRIARLGDDDFAVVLEDCGRGDARQIAASIRSTVARSLLFESGDPEEEELALTVSIGTASFPADADNENELVERAREALDEARSLGRNRVWCYMRRPRVPLQVPVYFDAADPVLVGYSRDLSPSGIFVQTTAGIDVGMRCALAFSLPGYEGKVHVVGRVVRAVHPQLSADDPNLRIPGLGVEFERFGANTDRRAIDAFLHGRESTSLRPETGQLSF